MQPIGNDASTSRTRETSNALASHTLFLGPRYRERQQLCDAFNGVQASGGYRVAESGFYDR